MKQLTTEQVKALFEKQSENRMFIDHIPGKVVVLEWKHKCNCPDGQPRYEIQTGVRSHTELDKKETARLAVLGLAVVRHAVDSIEMDDDFDAEIDLVSGPFLTI